MTLNVLMQSICHGSCLRPVSIAILFVYIVNSFHIMLFGPRKVLAVPDILVPTTTRYPVAISAVSHVEDVWAILTVYVVTLQGVVGAHINNKHRLDDFIYSWRKVCGDRIQFKICAGETDKRRGYGLTRTWVRCLQQAIADGGEYSTFLEDDARLNTYFYCNSSYRDLMWAGVHSDALLILLGAHDIYHTVRDGFMIKLRSLHEWLFNVSGRHQSFHKNSIGVVLENTRYSLGSYGFVVPRDSLEILRSHFIWTLAQGSTTVSPDISWYDLAYRTNKRIYVTSPTVVSHLSGHSNTWNKSRTSHA